MIDFLNLSTPAFLSEFEVGADMMLSPSVICLAGKLAPESTCGPGSCDSELANDMYDDRATFISRRGASPAMTGCNARRKAEISWRTASSRRARTCRS
eukprot:CAMPEP_0115606810 /NCGR_PEP_ID=MMETSP0272-20121206/18182_1 /TAXON_ID=71861 /ORGANISM="Scrippsiella trochoidea, Strain CCMP3099" /LENGTH=97 /DNA_ID=CAMNT_0003042469 /DNA_START=169 /DNA_END=462 /DNA_ORIENTATION=-